MKTISRSIVVGILALILTLLNLPGINNNTDTALAAGGNYFVSADGSDSNPGTQDLPWKTIKKAENTMVPGDTVTVLAGNYNERVQVKNSGSSGLPISYQASGKVVMNGFTVAANYVTIKGFEITNTVNDWEDGYGIWVSGSYNTLENNYIYYATKGGIRLFSPRGQEAGTSYNTIRNNRLYRNSQNGIEVFGQNNLIEKNEIWGTIQYHPNWPNQDGSADANGISFFGSGHVFRGNYIHDISYDAPENVDPHIDCFQSWADDNHDVGNHTLFEKNICINLEAQGLHETGIGFMIRGAHHLIIRNNIIRAYKIINSIDSSNLTVVNNTFSNALYLTDEYSPVIFFLSNSPNFIIKNNIFYDPALHVIWVNDNVSKQGLDVGYNLAYRSDGRRPYGSPYPHDLWQVNPMFVNPGTGDFHLLPNSPAINSGTLLDVVDDFDGIPRPLSYQFDIGTYEYPYKLDINPPLNRVNSPIYITITFATIGKPITINTKLPLQLSYQSSSTNCPGNVTFSNTNQTVTLTQTSSSISKCDLKISTKVNTDLKMSVSISTTIENDSVVSLNLSQNIILNGIPNFLPLASKT